MTLLWRLLQIARPHWRWMMLSVLVSAAATLANIGLMATSGWFITAMGMAGAIGATINYFTPAALIRALAIVRTGGRYLERLISHEATLRFQSALRGRLFAGLVPLVPLPGREWRSSDLAGRLSADIDRLELVFLRLVMPMAVAGITMISVGLGLSWIAPGVGFSATVMLGLFGFVVPALIARRATSAGALVTQHASALRWRLVDDLDGLGTLSVSGRWPLERTRLLDLHQWMIDGETRQVRASALGLGAMTFVSDLSAPVLLMLSVPMVRAGTVAGADLTLVLLTVLAAFEAFRAMPDAMTGLADAMASARRLFDLIDSAPTVRDAVHPLPLAGGFAINLDGLCLTHDEGQRPVLNGLSLTVPEGSFMAIVGESGAGKSSLARALVRLVDLDGGRITLGGTDIAHLALAALRQAVLLVPQAPYLMAGTIADNLRLADPEARPATMAQALEISGFDSVLNRLPEGLDTAIGTAGTRLSGGEGRRLAIARALLKDPPVLVLDEPTEGLDQPTAVRLLAALAKARQGRTTIVITHRHARVDLFDRVVTIEGGRALG